MLTGFGYFILCICVLLEYRYHTNPPCMSQLQRSPYCIFLTLTKIFALKRCTPDMYSCCNLSSLYLCGFALGKLGQAALVRVNGHAVLTEAFRSCFSHFIPSHVSLSWHACGLVCRPASRAVAVVLMNAN